LRWTCGGKPKPKAVNKPSPHSIMHGLDKPGVFTTVSKNENHPSILDAHAGFLLTRDLATLNVIFLLTLGPTALLFAENTRIAVYYTIALAVLYGLISQAARTYGKRFVTNALAVESSVS